jgi:predicted AlkP superfamily pyrophosphatase or phosphodiesterase
MSKVILVLSDALRDDVALRHMGYLEHLVERRHATRYTAVAEMPTMSRPNYETVHTGVPCTVHGITNNYIVRRSSVPNVFQHARGSGKSTAASAYFWFSELYNHAPFDPVEHREVDDESLDIQHGRFYFFSGGNGIGYPDVDVFSAGAMLARRYFPDYLLIHPMMNDALGEEFGGDSYQYRRNVIAQDTILANLIPPVLTAGYTVLVTGDHGMCDDPSTHGGSIPQVRNVPLYIIPSDGRGNGNTRQTVSQLQIAPTILSLLGLTIPETMRAAPIPVGETEDVQ